MKLFLFTFFFIIAGSFALSPQSFNIENVEGREQRIVTNNIRRAIQEVQKSIRDAGLDPVLIESASFEERNLIVSVSAFIENFSFTGLSNIAINLLNYDFFFNTLNFNLSLPQLTIGISASGVEVAVLGTKHTGEFSGVLLIRNIRLSGQVRFAFHIINGFRVLRISTNFRIGSIESYLKLVVLGEDFSSELNNFLNFTVSDILLLYRAEIDAWFTEEVRRIIDDMLSSNLLSKQDIMMTS